MVHNLKPEITKYASYKTYERRIESMYIEIHDIRQSL